MGIPLWLPTSALALPGTSRTCTSGAQAADLPPPNLNGINQTNHHANLERQQKCLEIQTFDNQSTWQKSHCVNVQLQDDKKRCDKTYVCDILACKLTNLTYSVLTSDLPQTHPTLLLLIHVDLAPANSYDKHNNSCKVRQPEKTTVKRPTCTHLTMP